MGIVLWGLHILNIPVFWDMTPYELVCRYQRFGEACCQLLQGGQWTPSAPIPSHIHLGDSYRCLVVVTLRSGMLSANGSRSRIGGLTELVWTGCRIEVLLLVSSLHSSLVFVVVSDSLMRPTFAKCESVCVISKLHNIVEECVRSFKWKETSTEVALNGCSRKWNWQVEPSRFHNEGDSLDLKGWASQLPLCLWVDLHLVESKQKIFFRAC